MLKAPERQLSTSCYVTVMSRETYASFMLLSQDYHRSLTLFYVAVMSFPGNQLIPKAHIATYTLGKKGCYTTECLWGPKAGWLAGFMFFMYCVHYFV